MKAAKLILVILILIISLVISLAACNWEGNRGKPGQVTPQPGSSLANDITATFGADQFHTQLTAIAEEANLNRVMENNPSAR